MSGKEQELPKKVHIHTTITQQTKKLLDEYAKKEDENGKKIFGNKSKVIERAIELLDNHFNPENDDVNVIWNRARSKNMVLVGKTTFLAYISGKKEKPYKKNLAVESIEWYLGKRKEEMTFEEFLNGIKGMWHVANYFQRIELDKNEQGAYKMDFYHELNNKKYSIYWASYFETVLKDNWNCTVDSFKRSDSLYLTIKEI